MSECKDLAIGAFNEKPQINITTHTHTFLPSPKLVKYSLTGDWGKAFHQCKTTSAAFLEKGFNSSRFLMRHRDSLQWDLRSLGSMFPPHISALWESILIWDGQQDIYWGQQIKEIGTNTSCIFHKISNMSDICFRTSQYYAWTCY